MLEKAIVGEATGTYTPFGNASTTSTCGWPIDANLGAVMFGISPPRVSSDPAGVTLTEPGVRSAISIAEPVATSEVSEPLLRPTWDAEVTERPVPPEVVHLCTATF